MPLKVEFERICNLFNNFNSVCNSGASERGGEFMTFFEFLYAKRWKNTIIALGVNLIFGLDKLRIDSFGTHLNCLNIFKTKRRAWKSFVYFYSKINSIRPVNFSKFFSQSS